MGAGNLIEGNKYNGVTITADRSTGGSAARRPRCSASRCLPSRWPTHAGTRHLALAGSAAAVNRALNGITLTPDKASAKARLTLAATAGHQHRQVTIAINS